MHIYLGVNGMSEQAFFAVNQRNTGFIAGGFKAEYEHSGGILGGFGFRWKKVGSER